MRALTVKQPWADLIVAGAKNVENRTWPVPSTMPVWMTCLGCYATRSPGEELDGCECENGYQRTPDRGVLHPAQAFEWVPSSEVEPTYPSEVGRFPFRLAIHAASTRGTSSDGPPGGGRAMLELARLRNPSMPLERPPLGALVGFVTVTGCHHADECHTSDGMHDTIVGPQYHDESRCSRWAEPDVYHWTIADAVPLVDPVPMRGRQGLWRLPEEAAALDRPLAHAHSGDSGSA